MTNKEAYQHLCTKEKTIPLFLQYDWFNALYNATDWEVVVEHKGEEVVAFLPYVITKKKGFKLVTPQFLSPYQGVWIKEVADQKYANRLGYEKEVITSLIDQLPKVDSFKQNFLPHFTNGLPFYWKGYNQTTRYTYILEDLSDVNQIFADFKENIRREIKKAEKKLSIITSDDIDLMYLLKANVYESNEDTYPIPLEKLQTVFELVKRKKCGELLMAIDENKNVHSMLLYVWDDVAAYYLHGVTDTPFKTTGSMSLLLWEAIQRSAKKTKAFNFEGSMVESIERYFRAFGGKQTPYFQINKTNAKVLKLLNY